MKSSSAKRQFRRLLAAAALVLACLCSLAVLGANPEPARIAQAEPSASTRAQVDTLFAEGYMLQKNQETDAALAKYQAALKVDPNHVPTLYEIGWSYWVLERWQDVVNSWSRVLELQPQHEDAASRLSEAKANLRVTTEPPTDNAQSRAHAEAIAAARAARRAADPNDRVVMTFAGDVAYPEGWNGIGLISDKKSALFAQVRGLVEEADLNFVNLECPFTSRAATVDKKFPITCLPERLDYILDAGFNLFSLANNHSTDAGRGGTDDTLDLFEALNSDERPLWWAGVSRRDVEPEPFVTVQPPGSSLRVGFLALASGRGMTSIYDSGVPDRVAAAAAATDLVVVSVHTGREYRHVPGKTKVAQYRALIDAGADIVVGHHPHVVQGVERYREGLIFHSLGNFSFGSKTSRHLPSGARLYSMMGRVTVEGGEIVEVEWVPLYANNSRPWTLDDQTLVSRHATPQLLAGAFAQSALDEFEQFARDVPGNESTRFTRIGDRLLLDLGRGALGDEDRRLILERQAREYALAVEAGAAPRPATERELRTANVAGTPASKVRRSGSSGK
jgi:poly-gamma-glutamate synthesis protein (capsule biosynthesis protein)